VTELSVVMPVYDELAVIERVLRDLRSVLDQRLPGDAAEMVVVDDCSTDGTAELLEQLALDLPGLVVLRQSHNHGPGPALYRAIEASTGDWLLHLDTDGQTDPEDLWLLWDRRNQADLLIGVRSPRRDPRHRLVLTVVTRMVVRVLSGRRLVDANAPFKLIRRSVWQDLLPAIDSTAFAPSLLVALGAARRGWRVDEVAVSHRQRPVGRSTFRLGRLAGAVMAAGRQATAFRFRVDQLPPRQQASTARP
jgi:dolichol-phosphate mannosyltransferase